jgi:hypothetical protein
VQKNSQPVSPLLNIYTKGFDYADENPPPKAPQRLRVHVCVPHGFPRFTTNEIELSSLSIGNSTAQVQHVTDTISVPTAAYRIGDFIKARLLNKVGTDLTAMTSSPT